MKRLMVLGLVFALSLSCLAGCGGPGGTGETPDVQVTATPTPTLTPIPTPDTPATPDVVVAPPGANPETTPEVVNVPIYGVDEEVSMTAVNGSFASSGGPAFTLLVDQERYQVNDVGGYCYITLRTGMSGDVYAEIGYRPNSNSDALSASILSEYGVMNTEKNLGMEQLGSHTVLHLRGETIQNIFDVYLLDVDSGCVTLVTSTTAESEAHRARLTASLETLELS